MSSSVRREPEFRPARRHDVGAAGTDSVAGMGLFVAASTACALAPSIGWLIAARALQGAGAALLMPLAMALLSVAFPREERAKALGLFGGITGLALISGPVVGGAVAQG